MRVLVAHLKPGRRRQEERIIVNDDLPIAQLLANEGVVSITIQFESPHGRRIYMKEKS